MHLFYYRTIINRTHWPYYHQIEIFSWRIILNILMLILYFTASMFNHIVYDKQCQNTLLRFYCIARRLLMWWKLCLLIHENNAYLFGLFPTPLQFNPFLHFINEFIKAPEDLGGYRYLVPSKVALRYTASLNNVWRTQFRIGFLV